MKLDAPKSDQAVVELSKRDQVHSNQNTEWKNQLLERAAEMFSKDRKTRTGGRVSRTLHARNGQLSTAAEKNPSYDQKLCLGR